MYALQFTSKRQDQIIPPSFEHSEDSILSSPEIGGKCLHSFAGNTRRSPAFEPLMYLVSVGSVLMEAKHDGIANEIVGARES